MSLEHSSHVSQISNLKKMNTIEGKLIAEGLKFGIVAGRFNEFIGGKLLEGAMDAIKRHGASTDDVDVAWFQVLSKFHWLLKNWLSRENTMP